MFFDSMRSEVWLFHLSAQTVFVSSEHHLHSGVFVRLLQQNAVCLLQRRCPPQKDTLFKQTLELLPSSFLMLCPPISESGLQRNPQQSLDICAAFRRVFVADHRHGLQAGLSCQTPALMGGGVGGWDQDQDGDQLLYHRDEAELWATAAL